VHKISLTLSSFIEVSVSILENVRSYIYVLGVSIFASVSMCYRLDVGIVQIVFYFSFQFLDLRFVITPW
jgi:hypothetical protein